MENLRGDNSRKSLGKRPGGDSQPHPSEGGLSSGAGFAVLPCFSLYIIPEQVSGRGGFQVFVRILKVKILKSRFNLKIMKALAETFGEAFLDNLWGSDPVETVNHTHPRAGYPAVPESWGSLASVST